MSRVYTRIFSDESYAAQAPSSQPSVVIGANSKRMVRMKVGSEGRITDVTVKQLESQTQVPFSVDILKSRIPFPDIDVDIPNATAPADTIELYSAIPTITAIAGAVAELETNEIGYAYKNMDGSYTNNQQYLYMLLQPTAGVSTTWKIEITVERDVG